ncbi:hypothetical protein KKD49_18905 [Myxococcota bacterium]|nr:hypothetical protein [Myxococcota bacterium]
MKINLLFLLITLTLVACVPPQEGTSPAGGGGVSSDSNPDNPGTVSVKTTGKGPVVDLRYKFKKGAVFSYTSIEESEMALSTGGSMPGGMGITLPGGMAAAMNMKFRTETDFSLAISEVNDDQSAAFTMSISKFRMYAMPSKTLVATNEDISSEDLSVTGTITSKGAVTFNEDIHVVITEAKKRYLVRGKVSKTGASAQASDGEQEITVFAEYDPKTGAVIGGVKTKKKAKVPATIKVSSSDMNIEILPRQFMQYFALPEGNVTSGSKTTVKAPMMNLSVVVSEPVDSVTNLVFNIETNAEGVGPVPEEAKATMPVMTGKAETGFNNTLGRLESIKGNVKMSMNAGVKMDITSTVSLTLKK